MNIKKIDIVAFVGVYFTDSNTPSIRWKFSEGGNYLSNYFDDKHDWAISTIFTDIMNQSRRND
jgi:putative lipoic acid-binding regulatory protein